MLLAGSGVVGPKRGFVENPFEAGDLLLFLDGRLVDAAKHCGETFVDVCVLEAGQLAHMERCDLVARNFLRGDGVEEREGKRRARGERGECSSAIVGCDHIEEANERGGDSRRIETSQVRDYDGAKRLVI